MHMAQLSGRFCGRKWTRSGASGREESVTGSASMQNALDNGWEPHPERTNQSTGSESWSQNGNVRFKRRQLGNRDGY